MRVVIVTLAAVILIGALPGDSLGQGRSGGSRPSGGGRHSGPVDMPRQGPDSSWERGQNSDTEGIRRERPREQSSQQQARGPEDHPAPSERSAAPAPEDRGGVLGSIRRFFGFGRSQEVMSEQGLEHERATSQERARVDKRSDDDGDDEPDE